MINRIIKNSGAILLVLAAVVGIVFVVYGYLYALAKPYNALKKNSEFSRDAIAYDEEY